MSHSGHSNDGGYNGLKAFAFTVGVTVLIFTVLYVARRYNPTLLVPDRSSRSNSWYLRGPNDPPEAGLDRRGRSLGERPRMWDIWIASWYSPHSRPVSPSGRLWLSQGQDENEKRGASRGVDGEKKPYWAEFLVSRVLRINSINPLRPCIGRSCLFFRVSSRCLQTRCQTLIPQFPHPKPWTIAPSSPHHLPKSKSTPSSLCLPLLVPRLHLQLPHRATPASRQESMRLVLPTSHAPRATNFSLLDSEAPAVVCGFCAGLPNRVDPIRGPLLL